MGTVVFNHCQICSSVTTPMRPSTCLDCHEVTISLARTGKWAGSLGWGRYEWALAMPTWIQQRAGTETRRLVRLLGDTPLRYYTSAYAEHVAQDLRMATLDDLARFLNYLQTRSVVDLAVDYPRSLDDDASGDHGPKCGCQKWALRLRPGPPRPAKGRRA